MRWKLAIEIVWLIATVGFVALLFWGAVWSYPQGRHTIWPIGFVTMAAAAGMSLPSVIRAWRAPRAG